MTKLVVRSDATMYMLLDADAKITGILGLTSGQVPSDLIKSTADLLTLRLDSETPKTGRRVLANDTLTVALADTSRRLPILASDSLTVLVADNVARRTVGANDTLRVIVVDGVIARPIIVSDVLTVQLIEAPIVASIYKGDDPLPLLSTETVIESGPGTAGDTIQDEAGGTVTDEAGDPLQDESVVDHTPEFFVTFTSSINEGGFILQAAAPSRATIVSGGRDGATSVRLHTEPGDDNLFGSGTAERCDLTLDQDTTSYFEGEEHWWGHSILFPTDYVDPPQSALVPDPWYFGVVFDFHNTGFGAGQSNFMVKAMPATAVSGDRQTGIYLEGYGGPTLNGGLFQAPVGPVVRNVWFDFVYNVRWSSTGSGFFKAWVNGALKLNHVGPTLYTGQGVYLKLANYHEAHGQASSVIHDRIVKGPTWQSVSLTPLEGV